jgi:hypothetical protein
MAGNRFFASAKSRRKKFHIRKRHGFKPLLRALISGIFSRNCSPLQNRLF